VRRSWKAVLVDYDLTAGAPLSTSCTVCLTRPQVKALLAISETLAWTTRYYSPTSTPIDEDKTDAFASDVRKRLMSACCDGDVLSRFDEDGTFQTSVDGGETWEDNPQADPRNSIVGFPPLGGEDGEAKRCDAANSIVAYFKIPVADIQAAKESEATFAALQAILVGILIVIGIISGGWVFALLGAALGVIFFEATAASWAAAWSEEAWQALLCSFYEHLEDDASFLPESIAPLLADIAALDVDNLVKDFMTSMIETMGAPGLTNAARLGYPGTLSCDDCGAVACTNEWDEYNANGTAIVSQNGIHIIVDSEALSGGLAYATITTTDQDLCCKLMRVTAVTGTITECAIIACGEPDVAFSATFNITGNDLILSPTPPDVWIIQIKGTTVFQVDINIAPPG